jgi:hypothetical protein
MIRLGGFWDCRRWRPGLLQHPFRRRNALGQSGRVGGAHGGCTIEGETIIFMVIIIHIVVQVIVRIIFHGETRGWQTTKAKMVDNDRKQKRNEANDDPFGRATFQKKQWV